MDGKGTTAKVFWLFLAPMLRKVCIVRAAEQCNAVGIWEKFRFLCFLMNFI